jgi:hypothetical protein
MGTNTDINVVSFSGGRTSAYLVYLMEQKRKNEGWDVHYVFMDTGAEHPKTYEFIKNVAFYFDIDLVCLRLDASTPLGKGNRYDVCSLDEIGPDLKPFAGMVKKYGSPGIPSPWCTARMKIDTYDAYCNKRFGKGKFVTWLGIRADEKRRLKRKENLAYLADISDATKDDILDWWAGMFFDLEIHEHLGNCVFCFKKGDGKLALAARDYPEGYEEFWSMIADAGNRKTPRIEGNEVMYRNRRTLPEVIAQFEDFSYQEIWDSLRFTKKFDTNSCSESCEVFNFDE